MFRKLRVPASNRDLLALSIVQAGNYLIPLMLLPFYARVLGKERWGYLAAALGISVIVQTVVEYGFQYSLAVEVAQSARDTARRARLLTLVVASRVLIATVVGVFAILAVQPLAQVTGGIDNLALALACGLVLGFNFLWLLRPLSLVSAYAAIDIVWRVLGAIAILAFVRNHDGVTAALLLQLLAALGNISTQAVVARNRVGLHFAAVKASDLARSLINGATMALFVIFVMAYTTANVLIVGLLSGPSAAGAYAGAEKLAKAGTSALQPLVQATFGQSASLAATDRSAAADHIREVLRVSLVAGITLTLVLLFGAKILVPLVLGRGYGDAVMPLLLLAPLPLLTSVTIPLGVQWLIPSNSQRLFLAIIGAGGLTNIALALILCPGLRATGMAIAVLSSEIVVTLLMVGFVSRTTPSPLRGFLARGGRSLETVNVQRRTGRVP